ncbi:MAG TPA: S-4TM family putative pore-forming effector [Terriglobales bacterium]|nr:S-4TM family putative pore-forming effector [Terriglobales bacterium]
MANSIPKRQNEEDQLRFLRARQQTYAQATRFLLAQLVVTLLVPLVGAVLAIIHPPAKPYVAAASLVVLLLDILWLDRRQKTLVKRAAKIAEHYDCAVLELPWNEFTVGDRIEAEEIHSAAKAYAKHHDDTRLRDWYPIEVGALPLLLGRIVCQRTNLHYDRRLRTMYGDAIRAGAIFVVLVMVIYGLAQNLSITAWVLTMAPAAPVLAWAGREFYRQHDTAEPLEKLLREARKFWNDALFNGCDESQCLIRSREFQNAIYSRRSSSPLVFPLVYRFRRAQLEDEMHDGAADFLKQYEQAKSSPLTPK